MNELFDYLKKQIETGDCPVSYIQYVFGERENYFELLMKDGILIVKDKKNSTSLGFAPHGAGRNYSRTDHCKLKLQNKNGYELFEEETQGLDVRFFSGKIDISELPSAYKNADKIKEQIKYFNLGTIVDEIEPYGCIMAGHIDKPWRKKK